MIALWSIIQFVGELRHRSESYQIPVAVLAFVTAIIGVLSFFFPMERLPPDTKATPKKTPAMVK